MPDTSDARLLALAHSLLAILDIAAAASADPADPDTGRKARDDARSAAADLHRAASPDGQAHSPAEGVLASVEAIRSAARSGNPAELRRTISAAACPPFPYFGPLADAFGDLPDTLLRWGGKPGALLTAGEVLVVSGAGGQGKSSLTLQWALAAAGADGFHAVEPRYPGDTGFVAAFPAGSDSGGVEIRRGPVVIGGYEDLPAVMHARARRILAGPDSAADLPPSKAIPSDLTMISLRGLPLYGPVEDRADGDRRAALYNARPGLLPPWRPFWDSVSRVMGPRDTRPPGLVILDPATAAFIAEDIRTAPVREFLDACRIELDELDAGLIIVAHPSKAGRNAGGAGADGLSGSSAWFDASRGVLYLGRCGEQENDHDPAFDLRGEKANHGPSFAALTLRRDGPAAFRLETEGERRARMDAAADRKKRRRKPAPEPKPKPVRTNPFNEEE